MAQPDGLWDAVLDAIRAMLLEIARVLRQLWLQVVGMVFLLFAVVGVGAFIREYRAYDAGTAGVERVVAAVLFTAVFGWFAVTSFLRARQRHF